MWPLRSKEEYERLRQEFLEEHKDDPGYIWEEGHLLGRVVVVSLTDKELRDIIREEIAKSKE